MSQKTRVIGFRITDYEHQKIIEAQQAFRSLVISETTSDTLRSILKDIKRIHPKRRVLVYNFLRDREAAMLYSPTGVGKTWLSLAISLIKAGMGSLELLDWQNEDPQPVCYVDGEMLEEVILERIKGNGYPIN